MRSSAVSKNAGNARGLLVARLRKRHAHRQHVARIEARVDTAKREQAAKHHPCAHQQHERERDLADDEQPARADPDRALLPAAFLQGIGQIDASRSERRKPAGQDPREDRCGEHEEQDAAVDRDLVGARYLVGEQRRAGVEAHLREEQANGPAQKTEHERLDQELLEHPGAARTQRRADRELLPPRERPREDQVADVRARDQENQRDRSEQHHERHPDVADEELVQRHDGGAPACVLLGKLLLEPRRDDAHLGVGLRHVRARLQPRHDLRVVVLANRAVLIGVRKRHPEVPGGGAPGGHRKARGHDADDRVRLTVEPERAADDVRGRAKMALPESVAEDRDVAACLGILLGEKHAAEHRPRSHDLEEVGADGARHDRLGGSGAGQRELTEAIDRHPLEAAGVALPVVEVRRRDRERRHAGKRVLRRHVEDPHEPIRLVERQRAQQHRVDEAEDRRVGADAEREHGDDRQRERGSAQQYPEGITNIGNQRLHDGISG